MNSTANYRFEQLSRQRLHDLVWLHKAVYGKPLSFEYLLAKYDSAYTGHIFIGFLAYDENDLPAAFYGVIPCFISVAGEPLLVAQSVDTMTHPDHQKKGLFFTLATMTYALCQKENIRLIYGFPNQNSTPGFTKLGWQKVGELERFTFAVHTFPLEKMARKFGFLQKLYRLYAGMVLEKYNAGTEKFTENVSPGGGIGLLRNEPYLQYKTYNESWAVKAGNATVWVKIQNGLIVGDIMDFDKDIEEVIGQLKMLCFKLGVRQLQFQENTKTRLYPLLKNLGEPGPSFPIMIKDLGSGIDVAQLHFAFADCDIF